MVVRGHAAPRRFETRPNSRMAPLIVTNLSEKSLVEYRERQHECDQESIQYTHQYIRRDTQAGICSPDLPWLAMNVKQRLGVLRNRWQAANKLYTKGAPDDYERAGRELYGLLRESWERGVSEVL